MLKTALELLLILDELLVRILDTELVFREALDVELDGGVEEDWLFVVELVVLDIALELLLTLDE